MSVGMFMRVSAVLRHHIVVRHEIDADYFAAIREIKQRAEEF